MRIEALADRVIQSAKNKRRHFVAIAGPPGSGKSTLSSALHNELQSRNEVSKIIPMDGFHLDNAVLSENGLLSRKGAPQTFDTVGFLKLIKQLACCEDNILIPVFDRTQDASIKNAERVMLADRILIVEGNYLLLKEVPWSDLMQFWDQTIFINTDPNELEVRLVNRWVDLGMDVAEARKRTRDNDLLNIELVLNSSFVADIQIN